MKLRSHVKACFVHIEEKTRQLIVNPSMLTLFVVHPGNMGDVASI